MNPQDLEQIAEDAKTAVAGGQGGYRRSKSLIEEARDLWELEMELGRFFREAQGADVTFDAHAANKILSIIARDRRLALSGCDLDDMVESFQQMAPAADTNRLLLSAANWNPDALPEVAEIIDRIHGGHDVTEPVIEFLMRWGEMKKTPALKLFASIHRGDPESLYERLRGRIRNRKSKKSTTGETGTDPEICP